MSTVRIKICGITRPEDAALAAELGADYIGINLFAGPRKLEMAQASQIVAIAASRMKVVGLTSGGASSAAKSLQLTALQAYGIPRGQCPGPSIWLVRHMESRDCLAALSAEWRQWQNKKLTGEDERALAAGSERPQAFLLDNSVQGMLGGTGKTFDWNWIAHAREAGELEGLPPLILAGGLTPENVPQAIRIAHPYAVDVSSGVEVPGKPGLKDPIKMRDFIQAAREA